VGALKIQEYGSQNGLTKGKTGGGKDKANMSIWSANMALQEIQKLRGKATWEKEGVAGKFLIEKKRYGMGG